MKKIITLSCFVLFTLSINAQTATPAITTTTVETAILKEQEFDFGKIPQGKPVTHVFELVNTGKDSLLIQNVQAGCGCTTPMWERDKKIAPGTSAKITVGFNAASEGPFNKPVTITYNASETKQLFIKGEVWKTPAASAPENKSIDNF